MESPRPPEHTAVVRRYDGGESVRDGIRVGGEWKHQRVCEGKARCRSPGTGMLFPCGTLLQLVTNDRMMAVAQ